MFYLNIGEQEFPNFKRDQSIIVDFKMFPVKMIELIQLCLQNHANPNISIKQNELESCEDSISGTSSHLGFAFDNSPATFSAKLDLSNPKCGVFSIVESNRFKQLTHISLMMKLLG